VPRHDILPILREGVAAGASDIIISAGSPITFHIYGVLKQFRPDWVLDGTDSEDLIYQFLTTEQRKEFEMEKELDAGYHFKDIARFRVNVYQQKGTLATVLRVVPHRIPPPEEIGFPQKVLLDIANMPNGLILVTGPTGAGKSTTIASILEYMNTVGPNPKHIITIEDPIEFLFNPKLCVVDQREIGHDTKSYARGLRSALREMPHVIFVGEMRDKETIEIALTAAETGNVVVSTLSTQSAAKTINRIIDTFPVEHQAEIRTRLSLTLRFVVSQVLLQRVDVTGRICAREIMHVNSPISSLIREGKIHQIDNAIGTHAKDGMVLMDDSILDLYFKGVISYASAAQRVGDPEKARKLMAHR
jgi:twitching motility protein PilT